MPATTAAPSRTLYHSRLREMGSVAAVLTHRPRPSKFSGRPPYCRFIIDGNEFDYQCETPAIAEQLQAVPLNVPLRVTALGSKDAAHLEVEQADNFPTVPSGSSETPRRRDIVEPTTNARTAAQNRVQAPEAAPAVPTLSGSYFDCLEVAVVMVEAFRKRYGREPSECERAIACSLWIEQNRSNGSKPLTRGAQ